MKAVNLERIQVKCDNESCDFKEGVKLREVEQWHNKGCPKCGEIVCNDSDLAQIKIVMALADGVNNLVGDVPESTAKATITYDTANPLKEQEKE